LFGPKALEISSVVMAWQSQNLSAKKFWMLAGNPFFRAACGGGNPRTTALGFTWTSMAGNIG
jgi:hypothetical protein